MADYNGLIQHSFALQNLDSSQPFPKGSVKAMVGARFAHQASGCDGFQLEEIPIAKCEQEAACSPLLEQGLTTLDPQRRARFFEWNRKDCRYERPLPNAFSWADREEGEAAKEAEKHWERVIFAKCNEGGEPSFNDLLVRGCDSGEGEAQAVSRMLCELLGARRSMLFGLALANKFVNVALPHAVLTQAGDSDPGCGHPKPVEPWILQPVLSLIRIGPNGGEFRRMYCLSFFLVPVKGPCFEARAMRKGEIKKMVNAGWGLSLSPPNLPRFDLDGPLVRYTTSIEPVAEKILGPDARDLTLRKTIEAVTCAVATRMAFAPGAGVGQGARREIGDEVVSALGNSRVSSVTVVDGEFDAKCLYDRKSEDAFPGALKELMPKLAGRVRVPLHKPAGENPKYRLDRPFIDHGDYAIGVLPSNRCLLVASDEEEQRGRWESGLMQAGWIAYSVIASASAIGTMRAINQDLEKVDLSDPSKVVPIEHNVSVDLHEIYDLDITWEAYRHRYRSLRELLGITNDYKALHGKLDALFRETSAQFEVKTQLEVSRLNKWITVLAVLTLIVAIIALFVH